MHRLKTMIKEIKRLDPVLSENDDSFKAAVVVLSSASNQLKTAKELAKFTTYPTSFVRPILANLKMNGLGWRRNGVFNHGGWLDKETSNISFWLDVMTAQGLLQTEYLTKKRKA